MAIVDTHIRVIAGFPGVGKSSFISSLESNTRVIDLDSSNYRDNDINEKLVNYTNTIKSLLTNSNHLLLISTHKEVLSWLEENTIDYILVQPDSEKVGADTYAEERFNRKVDDNVFKQRMVGNWDSYHADLDKASPKYRIKLDAEEYLKDYIGLDAKSNGYLLNLPGDSTVARYIKNYETIKFMVSRYKDDVLTHLECYRTYGTWGIDTVLEFMDETSENYVNRFGYITKEELVRLSKDQFLDLGFRQWDEKGLRLIPIRLIPLLDPEMEVVSISDNKGLLKDVDKDIRYGCIAYGVYPNK